MTDLVLHRETSSAIVLPEPRVPISIRVATLGGDDLKFIDGLQKKHSKMVGFLHLRTLEAKMKAGHVLIAETKVDKSTSQQVKMEQLGIRPDGSDVDLSTCRLVDFAAQPLGYCVFQDRYDKHDDCGIFYQVNVVPGSQRGLIGAALVKAQLDRAAYGCKLACCWCAQDLEANHFWESLGFVPLAFRTGSRPRMKKSGAISKEGRMHIFWQRRIREGDAGPGATPYWFPSETRGGALREARIVLPIPPGTHWSDAKPAVLPGMESVNTLSPAGGSDLQPRENKPRSRGRGPGAKAAKPAKPVHVTGGLWFAPPAPTPEEVKAAKAKEPKAKPPRFKNDPKYVAAARELRDRYIEEINSSRMLPAAHGKYDVSRQLEAAPHPVGELKQTPLLKAA